MTTFAAAMLLSTSLLTVTRFSTFFSTVYQTSLSPTVLTIVSVSSLYTTLTKSDVVEASTIAMSTEITETWTNVMTDYSSMFVESAPQTPPTATITTTLTSILSPATVPTNWAITFHPSPTFAESSLPTQTSLTATTLPAITITVTELVLVAHPSASDVVSTMTTVLIDPTSTDSVYIWNSDEKTHGWSSWSTAEKGGAISGAILGFLLVFVVMLLLLVRRDNVWLARDWPATAPSYINPRAQGSIAQYQQTRQGYWPFTWGTSLRS